MEYAPSKYQVALFNEVKNTNNNIVVKACAGSGKTFSIVESLKYLPKDDSIAFVAFNKHIATTLQKQAPRHVDVMTLHSMGLKAVTASMGRKKVNSSKMFQIVKEMTENEYRNLSYDQKSTAMSIILKITGLIKSYLVDVTEDNIDAIANKHGITLPDNIPIYKMITTAMKLSESVKHGIDFNDMIWYVSKFNLECKKYDVIVNDETQDMTAAQSELILRSLKKGGRVIAVGDEKQVLYGFAGVDIDAMSKFIKRLDAKVMPLSISYRCPKSHVRLVQTIVPEIETAPNAIEGNIIEITEEEMMDYVSPDDLCICRYNAPLVRPAFNLLSAGIKVCIRGKDIGTGLIKLIKGFGTNNLNEMFKKLDAWSDKETKKAEIKGYSTDSIDDKYNTIMAFSDMANARNVSEIIMYIEDIFDDKKAQVTFSSVHRAKGLEADNVFIIKPSAMPSQKVSQDWEIQQEQNIMYVAYTRAKENL